MFSLTDWLLLGYLDHEYQRRLSPAERRKQARFLQRVALVALLPCLFVLGVIVWDSAEPWARPHLDAYQRWRLRDVPETPEVLHMKATIKALRDNAAAKPPQAPAPPAPASQPYRPTLAETLYGRQPAR